MKHNYLSNYNKYTIMKHYIIIDRDGDRTHDIMVNSHMLYH